MEAQYSAILTQFHTETFKHIEMLLSEYITCSSCHKTDIY